MISSTWTQKYKVIFLILRKICSTAQRLVHLPYCKSSNKFLLTFHQNFINCIRFVVSILKISRFPFFTYFLLLYGNECVTLTYFNFVELKLFKYFEIPFPKYVDYVIFTQRPLFISADWKLNNFYFLNEQI